MTDVLLTDDVELLAEILVSPSLFDTLDADMVVCSMKVVVGWLLAVVDNSKIE